jgi:hypothetical protein
MRRRLLLVLLLAPALARPAPAGVIFGKKTKPTPAERVPELIGVLKGDGDENKRAAAAEELRQYDPAAFSDIVPVLVDVLANDKKANVRSEAAQSLGKIRPVTPAAGQALEQALAKDPSMRVRLHARRALWDYHWHGYSGTKKDAPLMQTSEPPLAAPAAPPTAAGALPPPPPALRPVPAPLPAVATTPVPAPPVTAAKPPAPAGKGRQPQPLPPGPPAEAPADDGPTLPPP